MFTIWNIESNIRHLLKEAEKVEQNRQDYIDLLKSIGGTEYEMFLFDQIVPRLKSIIQEINDYENFRDIVLRSWEAQNKK